MNLSNEGIKKISDSDRALLDSMLEGVEDVSPCLEVYDGNFEEVSKDLNDSVGGALANVAISIAEQKKLLQLAKTPQALQSAIKLIAVTAGNLMHAGTSMLSWLGRRLPQRDSESTPDVQTYAAIVADGYTVLKKDTDSAGRNYAVIHRKGMDDYAISCGYDENTGDFGSVFGGFKTSDSAVAELGNMLKK